ncbi:MAG: glycoside hydrolase family 55 protein [Desulfobulbaceae bacterium]|nr:glycoside hydrolase family 55 protein [Desulfobulbaceae bacterium]HIJ91195.1 hypothetical protein [Deltaproteobacteria bacterium]
MDNSQKQSFDCRPSYFLTSSLPQFFVIFILSFFFSVFANGATSDDFVNPTVTQPFVDGVNLEIPEMLARGHLAENGLVDVTASPFLADPTGVRDSTAAIQKAVDFARDKQMVCFFPRGRYVVSDTIECIQNRYRRSNGVLLNGRDFPCVLVGSRAGSRPEIVLRAKSPGFQKPDARKYVFHFWARGVKDPSIGQPNISMNQMLINLDITIGKGNSGAVAIRHQGAQGSGVQETTINATHGLAGIEGGCGSGGSHANVTIIGGKIGMDMRESQPAPTIAGVTLIDQTQAAILYEGRQTLTAVGVKISSRTSGPVIQSGDGGKIPFRGQISLIDSEITFDPGGQQTAIVAGSSLYLRNVYVKNAARVVAVGGRILLPGNNEGWLHVVEFAHMVSPRSWKGNNYSMPIVRNGVNKIAIAEVEKDSEPPADLQRQHLLPSSTAGWEDKTTINVKAPPYLAKGDGKADDYAAIQRAINEHDAVFLPKGYYLISQPLKLKMSTKLFGVARHLSVITPEQRTPYFSSASCPAPLVETVDNPKSNTILAFLTLHVPNAITGAYALEWRSGGASMVRDVNFSALPPLGGFGNSRRIGEKNFPLVRITSSGGGSWWNFFQEEHLGQGANYRHLLISNVTGPVRFYQCNPEHAKSDANLEIMDSKGVHIYGLKGEGNKPVLRILRSEDVAVYGYGGNAAAMEGKALFEIIDSSDIILANLVDSPRPVGMGSQDHYAGISVDPSKWYMVIDKNVHRVGGHSAPLERPVLYRILRQSPL